MKLTEFTNALVAILILTIISSFALAMEAKWTLVAAAFFFSVIVIFAAIFAKKLMAYLLDADVEHTLWKFSQWGWKKHQHFEKEIPWGAIFPLFFSIFSLGIVKFGAILSYEAQVLKRRAARRFGYYSFTEMTEWHNSLIGAAGMVAVFVIVLVTYFLPFNGVEYLAKIAAYYAFSNMLPLPKLDGLQILFGSKILYTVLAVITLIFTAYALIL